ncbi:cation transporter [Spiroplasma taiwanense]|uniref:HMA domain-containing protein n=1 Tax=Spiroplasma taiwanense CT-1 TaxID=1276220 RepID=S5LZR5_9MOLU|nr:heavy metal-associated domain-containing protein [Spiroplasma taiwanense]AGR41187.1 hypothetical protein STAIW_v1c05650 [Spiroplasma taiwanense CT-1]
MNKEIRIYIDALDCASCAVTIDKTMQRLNIQDYNVLIPLKEVQISFDEQIVSEKNILGKLKKAGYKGEIIND